MMDVCCRHDPEVRAYADHGATQAEADPPERWLPAPRRLAGTTRQVGRADATHRHGRNRDRARGPPRSRGPVAGLTKDTSEEVTQPATGNRGHAPRWMIEKLLVATTSRAPPDV